MGLAKGGGRSYGIPLKVKISRTERYSTEIVLQEKCEISFQLKKILCETVLVTCDHQHSPSGIVLSGYRFS